MGNNVLKDLEIERRWIVRDVDKIAKSEPPVEIEQGYLDLEGFRVRVTSMIEPNRYCVRSAELTRKTGKGIVRTEETAIISLEAAQMLLETTTVRVKKTRYTKDRWEIDVFHGDLEGLIIVERELRAKDEQIDIPAWLVDPVEVTDTITNRMLAGLKLNACDDKYAKLLLFAAQGSVIDRDDIVK